MDKWEWEELSTWSSWLMHQLVPCLVDTKSQLVRKSCIGIIWLVGEIQALALKKLKEEA